MKFCTQPGPLNTLEIRVTPLDRPSESVDGETHNHQVRILRNNEIVSTGRGFEHKRDAEIWADGVRAGLQTAALTTFVTPYLARHPAGGSLDGLYCAYMHRPGIVGGCWAGDTLGYEATAKLRARIQTDLQPGTCLNLITGEIFSI